MLSVQKWRNWSVGSYSISSNQGRHGDAVVFIPEVGHTTRRVPVQRPRVLVKRQKKRKEAKTHKWKSIIHTTAAVIYEIVLSVLLMYQYNVTMIISSLCYYKIYLVNKWKKFSFI